MLKSFIAKYLAKFITKKEDKWQANAEQAQQKLFLAMVKKAQNTEFGKIHHFSEIKTIKDFQERVPLQDYETLKSYIDQIVEGKENVLWPGKPLYFAKTSGTTSGTKYIPISKESMPYHIEAARNALLYYIKNSQNANFVNGKMIFLQGSPELEEKNGIKVGRLSGISAHFVPNYLQKNRMPSWETNCIEDWETKVDKIVEETKHENMTLIGGIPPWLIMYFERLQEKTGKKIKQIFPNLQLIVTGGVNYEPYRQKMNELLGGVVDVIQTYPASEGFIAYQNQLNSEELLLLLDKDIFYEFVPVEEIGNENPTRLTIGEVELNKNYALIMSTMAGLWAYSIGDTVKFVSKAPYKIVVSGRIKHYTSAFGEHVIGQEVEKALENTLKEFPALVTEFHVAPEVAPEQGLPYHEWLIEFEQKPENMEQFAEKLNQEMCAQNVYYDDLIQGKILRPLVLTTIQKSGFNEYMKTQGKLGGQNKVPRLANDRKLAESLKQWTE
ncbi:GH3 auxin-responsive promoter family protein [Ornithobacterium rhinotracheale]|uniref:GH3 auxin-responsive promoter family protein n=1 Tax=Ornithobacterium rhinotracheale TaxID=28251 RepID=UPI004036F91F